MSKLKAALEQARGIVKYNADEERDSHGRFAGSGGQGIPSHSELMSMERVSGPLGSQGGEWRKDANGQQYLVKPLIDEKHGQNEVAAAAVYHEAGVRFPNTGVVKDANGDSYLVSQKIDGLTQKSAGAWQRDSELQARAAHDFGTDALLSHWDVHGLEADNTLVAQDGTPTRIESGGAMAYRAMGGNKTTFSPDAEWVEPSSMRTSDQGQAMYGNMTDAQAADSLERAGNINLDNVQSRWDAMGIPRSVSDPWMQTLQARQAQIPALVASLRGASKALSALKQARALLKYDENEARGEKGRWVAGENTGAHIEDLAQSRSFINRFHDSKATNVARGISEGKIKVVSATHEGNTSHIVTAQGTLHVTRNGKEEWAGHFFPKGMPTESGTGRVVFSGKNVSGLTGPEQLALTGYKGGMFVNINNELRGTGKQELSEYDRQRVKESITQIDRMMQRSPLPEAQTVYRGVAGKLLQGLKVGDSFTDKAYSSTSLSRNVAERFSGGTRGSVLEVSLPIGTRGIEFTGGKLGKVEQEILVDRNTTYTVTSISSDGTVHVKASQ